MPSLSLSLSLYCDTLLGMRLGGGLMDSRASSLLPFRNQAKHQPASPASVVAHPTASSFCPLLTYRIYPSPVRASGAFASTFLYYIYPHICTPFTLRVVLYSIFTSIYAHNYQCISALLSSIPWAPYRSPLIADGWTAPLRITVVFLREHSNELDDFNDTFSRSRRSQLRAWAMIERDPASTLRGSLSL